MSAHPGIKHVFCSLSMEEGRYNFSLMNHCENHLIYFHGVPNVCKGFPRRIWPVSYTHLDVYKRQPVFWFTKLWHKEIMTDMKKILILPFLLFFLIQGSMAQTPKSVSYTHLDVYKRQAYNSPMVSLLWVILTFESVKYTEKFTENT